MRLRALCLAPVAMAVVTCIPIVGAAQDAPPAGGGPSAGAAEPAPQPTAAEALYEQGLNDMLAGNYASGCPSLSESYRLDPMPGALFTLAECFVKWGKLATALSHYQDYLDRVKRMSVNERRKQQGRIEVAEKEVAGLASRVPQLTIVVPPDLPADAVVTRNGERVLGPMLNRQLPVDPGAHEVVLEAPGFERQVFSEQLGEGERREVRIAPLAAAGAGGPAEPPEDDGGGGSGITRTWAYVAGGVGIAGLLVGGIAGGVTIGHKGTIDDNCVDVNCNADGIDAADAASTTGAISTVGFIVGGIGIAAGVTFWFLADDEPASDLAAARRAPAVGLRSASSPDGRGGWLGLEGRW